MEEELHSRMQMKATKYDTVGSEGGMIKNCGCEIDFPAGAFSEDTKVETSVVALSDDTPEGFVPITPTLACISAVKPQNPAKVNMEPWVYPSQPNAFGYIYGKETEDSQWEFIEKVSVNTSREISFYTTRFTMYKAFMSLQGAFMLGVLPVDFIVEHLAYIGPSGDVICVSYLKNRKFQSELRKTMKGRGYDSLMPLPQILHVTLDDVIRVKLSCVDPQNLRIVSPGGPSDEDGDGANVQLVKTFEKSVSVRQVVENTEDMLTFQLKLQDSSLDKYDGLLYVFHNIVCGKEREDCPLTAQWPIPPPVVHHLDQ